MNDENDNGIASEPPGGEAGPASFEGDPGADRGRPSPPPKPKSGRPMAPSSPALDDDRPVSKPPLPRRSFPPGAQPAKRLSSSPAPRLEPKPEPKPEGKPLSIRPMQMIKLGGDTPRRSPPPSSVERLSSRPPPAPRVPSFDPPTIPLASEDIVEEPVEPPANLHGIEPPTLPDDEEEEPITPPRQHLEHRSVPAARRSPPPPPSSFRPPADSGPDIQIEIEPAPNLLDMEAAAEEVPDADVAPDSQDPDDIPVSEDDTPISDQPPSDEERVSVEPAEEAVEESADDAEPVLPELPLREGEKRKPPPPPKRAQAHAPSERAVAQALEAPRFESVSAKPRAKPWWEELFTDDFARGILPITGRQISREVDFIEDSLGVAKGGIVLDLACGTGQHAVELSSRGYGVVGFDLSVPQLATAGEHAQERGQKMNFLQGDMRDMSFDEVFDGIYCWNTSFGYFEEDKNVMVAQRVFRALRPGGSFLLDVANRDFIAQHQPSQQWFEGDSCVCMDDMSVDFITSRLRVKRTMMLDDGRTKECAYSIRIYSLHELGKLLHDIGFRVTEASGHTAYPGVYFGATSPRVIILAQKP